jgi:hypothetical protein
MSIRLNDLVQITVHGVVEGQAAVNVFHYAPDSVNDPLNTTLGAFVSAFRDLWRSEVLPLLSEAYAVLEYTGVVIAGTKASEGLDPVKVFDLTDVVTVTGVDPDDIGGTAGAILPTMIAASFQKRTGIAGKRNKGSYRIAGLVEAYTEASAGNVLTGAAVTALEPVRVFGETDLAGAGAEQLIPIVFSRTTLFAKAGMVNNTTGTWREISAVLLNRLVGSQRSRKQVRRLGA